MINWTNHANVSNEILVHPTNKQVSILNLPMMQLWGLVSALPPNSITKLSYFYSESANDAALRFGIRFTTEQYYKTELLQILRAANASYYPIARPLLQWEIFFTGDSRHSFTIPILELLHQNMSFHTTIHFSNISVLVGSNKATPFVFSNHWIAFVLH